VHNPGSPHFAGHFTFFHHGHHGSRANCLVDITRTVGRLKVGQADGPLSVTLMRIGCGVIPVAVRTPMAFNQMTISVTKGE
jgi:hypothetical protein